MNHWDLVCNHLKWLQSKSEQVLYFKHISKELGLRCSVSCNRKQICSRISRPAQKARKCLGAPRRSKMLPCCVWHTVTCLQWRGWRYTISYQSQTVKNTFAKSQNADKNRHKAFRFDRPERNLRGFTERRVKWCKILLDFIAYRSLIKYKTFHAWNAWHSTEASDRKSCGSEGNNCNSYCSVLH